MKRFVLASVALLAAACSGAQPRPVTWDQAALASIHVGAHALVAVDDGLSIAYQQATDRVAADGGPDGTSLRGDAWRDATTPITTRFMHLVTDYNATRAALIFAESMVQQAKVLGDTVSRCRAATAANDLANDFDLVAQDALIVGITVDGSLTGAAHDLASVVMDLSTGCGTDAAVSTDGSAE